MGAMQEAIERELDESTPEPNPYKVVELSMAQVYIDPSVQRDHPQQDIDRLVPWDWAKCEPLTVAPGRPGMYAIVEGQRRHARLTDLGYTGKVWCRIIEDHGKKKDQAKLGREISKGRRPMRASHDWRQRVRARETRYVAVDNLLATLGISVVPAPTKNGISAAGFLDEIVRRKMSVGDLVAHVERIVSVVLVAWPEEAVGEHGARWDNRILRTIDTLIRKNPEIDLDRVAAVLRTSTASNWIQNAKNASGKSPREFLLEQIGGKYNTKVRGPRRLAW